MGLVYGIGVGCVHYYSLLRRLNGVYRQMTNARMFLMGWFGPGHIPAIHRFDDLLDAYADQRIERLLASQDSGWRPIESAPKDGTAILVFCPHASPYQIVASFHTKEPKWSGWLEDYEGEQIWPPTHWMPLPAPPAE